MKFLKSQISKQLLNADKNSSLMFIYHNDEKDSGYTKLGNDDDLAMMLAIIVSEQKEEHLAEILSHIAYEKPEMFLKIAIELTKTVESVGE